VFSPAASNEEVYEAVGSAVVKQTMQGYNGTIFVYGQTTSGKTHTMLGTERSPGIIPQAIREVFQLEAQSNKELRYWVSYMEIYNETINDLLQTGNNNLKIREDPTEGYFVVGLRQVKVSCAADIAALLAQGEGQRSYRATEIHDHSSRSHTVFRLMIESREVQGVKKGADQLLHLKGSLTLSSLYLVDLAGSERSNEVGSVGAQETSHINKSLFVLANVINKLATSPGAFIPYRDSKLTRVLASALGGNSVTSVVCTLAPEPKYLQLSLSTLRFAARAKKVQNKPVLNEVVDDSQLLATYKARIQVLEKQLVEERHRHQTELERLKERAENAGITVKDAKDIALEARYDELLRNYDIQRSHRAALSAEVEALKASSTGRLEPMKVNSEGRFEELKAEFEQGHMVDIRVRLSMWDLECDGWRKAYYQEIADLEARLKAKMIAWLTSPSDVKQRPQTKLSVRPTTKAISKRDTDLNSRPTTNQSSQYRTVSSGPFKESKFGSEQGARLYVKNSRVRVAARTPKAEPGELAISPFKPPLVSTSLNFKSPVTLDRFRPPSVNSSISFRPASVISVFKETPSTAGSQLEASETSAGVVPVPEDRSDDSYFPCPNEQPVAASQGAVVRPKQEPLGRLGKNVMFSGLNKENCCGHPRTSKVLFHMLGLEFEQ
jgi:centromeric protein E